MAKHNEIGEIGESIAQKFLKTKGFSILDTNYRKKWGDYPLTAGSPFDNIRILTDSRKIL